eukprot:scaffold1164_cov65-Phaeocystis_antarctica.AAC.2
MHLVPHGRHVQAALVAHFQYVAIHPKVIGVARGEEARSGRAAEHLHVRLVQADSTEGEFVDVPRSSTRTTTACSGRPADTAVADSACCADAGMSACTIAARAPAGPSSAEAMQTPSGREGE